MITSLTSPKIVRVRRLMETHSPRDRAELGHYVVEGLRAVEGALAASTLDHVEVFATSKWLTRFPTAIEISDEVAADIAGTISPQGIFAILPLDKSALELSAIATMGHIALFVELQDPGNAGTIIRNAHAFGIDAIIFSKGSVDPYSAKVVRSSAGSISHVPLLTGADSVETVDSLVASHQVLAFDMLGEPLRGATTSGPVLMIFGNEARGLPEEILGHPSIKKVSIEMSSEIESLNVASAATIAMYEISQRD